jgi:C-terminal processing protease CtpA/Prc
MNSYNQGLVQDMLREVYEEVKAKYYDPTYHGVNLEASYKEHAERLKKATTLGEGFMIIEGMLEGLNDSHTFFQPPVRPYRFDSGFRMQMIGDRAFIQRVREGTDAETKLHPGDEVLKYAKYSVNRDDLWRLDMAFNRLSPASAVGLQVRGTDGKTREVMVSAKEIEGKRITDLTQGDQFWQFIREAERDNVERNRTVEMQGVMIWQMPSFVMTEGEVDRIWGIAKKHKALILDLRGNRGGLVTLMERMVGNAIGHDVKIAERKSRKEGKPLEAKGRGEKAYEGKIIVLVDSNSASAAELFARVMQLEGRGTVVGDRSAGAVMEARYFPMSHGLDTKIFFGCSITDADLVMKDGKSLEKTGVVPDELVLPTGQDLAEGKDPALSRAAELAGLKLDATTAGKLFPFQWKPL